MPFDLEWRFDSTNPGLLWWAFDDSSLASVPFTLWNVGIGTFDDPSDDKQLIALAFSGGVTPGVYDVSDTDPAFGSTECFDWVYAYDGDYAAFATDATDGSIDGDEPSGPEYFARALICNSDAISPPVLEKKPPGDGTTIRWFTTKPNRPGADEFVFSTRSVASDPGNAARKKVDALALVNVFPNPYVGLNRLERNNNHRFVRFTHLPSNTTIRIFNLAGTLARTLWPEQQVGQDMDWDLLNKYNKRVASGIYLAYVEMPGVGAKVLKLVIVQ